MTAIVMTALATALLAGGGYALAAGLARRLRRSVERERDTLYDRCAVLEAELSTARDANEIERTERARAERRARDLEVHLESSRNMREELESLVAPLARRDGAREVAIAVNGVLGPMVEHARAASELSRLKAGRGLVDLPALLDAITASGGFSAVLLSDDSGLPVAGSQSSHVAEDQTGVFSLLLTMADRLVRAGAHAPRALLIQDEDNQITVHRVFRVGGERYLLSAFTRRGVGPDALDAALPSLEATLSRRAA